VLASIAGGFHFAALHHLLKVSAATWNAAAVAYPSVVALSAAVALLRYAKDDGSAEIASAMGGWESDDVELARLVGAVHAHSGLGGKPPRVFVIPSDEPNAFAAGTGASVVAVTTGLRELLNRDELRAVLAHEIGHLRNEDMGRSLQSGAIVAGLGVVMSAGDILSQIGRGSERDDDDDDDGGVSPATLGLILYAAGALSYRCGSLLRLGSSRTVEFAADAFAKSIGAGADLASALRKLDEFNKFAPLVTRERGVGLGLASGAFASSYIDNPPARESPLLTLGGLLRTHPAMEDRIARLL
jgi:heat shock protein HtpX